MPNLMQGGLGLSDAVDGFFQARDAERKRRQEEEAPAALSALLDAASQRNTASPSPVFAPMAGAQQSAPMQSAPMQPSGTPQGSAAPVAQNEGIRAAVTRGRGSAPSARNLPDAGTTQAIAASAQRLGVDPVDLATVISYESAGSFSPAKWGGAGGRHLGLIQFGPAERAQFGAHPGQTVEEQLQSAEKYLTTRGFKPGMGILDLYSTINAGRPGLYNASDARNGGAPGTVADKVNYQFGPHRARAQAMFNALGGQGGAQVAAPLPPRRPTNLDGVQVAEDEAATQQLERATHMVGSNDPAVSGAQGQVASRDPSILPAPSPAMQRVEAEAKAKGIGQTATDLTPAQALMTQAATRDATVQPAQPAPAFTGFAGVNGGAGVTMTPQLKAAALAAYRNPNTRPMAASILGEILKGKQSEFSLENVNGHAVLFNKRNAAMIPLSALDKAPEPFTLGDNQIRYDSAGRVIARGPDKAQKDATSIEEHNHYVAEEKAAGRTPKSYEQWDLSRRRSQNQAEFGTIPAGHRLVRGENGDVSMVPIAGSPAEREQKEAADKADQTKRQAATSGGIVVQDIDRVLKLANDPDNLPITGGAGNLLSRIPYTAAHDAAALLETVKANATFDRLQQMRASSPTGGALGAVSDFENRRLAATIGNLEQSQSKDQFVENLKRVKNTYLDIVHGEGKGPPREPSGPAAAQPAARPAQPAQSGTARKVIGGKGYIRKPDGNWYEE